VTLPRPDLPIVLLSHRGPVSFGRDESGRTANRGAGGLVTVLIGADAGPSRRRLGMRGSSTRVVDQLDVRGVLSVPVQLDGRTVGTPDVHATSRGLVGRS
jgi:hypothetical protein